MAPFCLQWENISVKVTEKRHSLLRTVTNERNILKDISGYAFSGCLIAVLGPSGSGKTTFFDAISGKLKGRTGSLKINNMPVSDRDMCNMSCCIQQEDVFTESLTALEHMQFMAALKLYKTEGERSRLVEKLLVELSMDESKHTIIGMLSGGQRRRLSLATELLSDPHILFCDEPTTGLDSFSAMTVVKILEATAMSGKLVLVTLHQPSSQIFDLFNDIILLANGKLIFQGSKVEARRFFERANMYCPDSYNPAEFYINSLTTGFEEDYRNFPIPDTITNTCDSHQYFKPMAKKKNFFMQLRWLTWRVFIDFIRSFYRYKTSYVLLMITALIIGAVYYNVNMESTNSIQNVQGALILIISELVFTHMYYVIYIFPEEVVIFVREKSLYSALPYYLSKLLSLIPVCLINALSFLIVYFAMLEFLQGFSLFLDMSVVLFLTSLSGISLGLCLSALFPTVEHINLFIVPLEIVIMTVSGIWVQLDTLPKIFRIMKYFSPFYYGFQSVSTLCWTNIVFAANCTTGDVLPCFDSGEDVLKQYRFYEPYDVVGYNNLYLLALTLVYCSIGYLGILRKRAVSETH